MTPSDADIQELVSRDRVVETLGTLVRTPSENPPGDELAVALIAEKMCGELGFDVSLYEAQPDRPSVVARKRYSEGPTLCYCSHLDVVPVGDRDLWDHDPFGADIVDGRMLGRGSCDAKGPIAAALEAVAALDASGRELRGTLELALVADEETMGFQGAAFLVEEGIVKPDMAIVGEPTSLRVVRAQRGACWFRITTRGRAVHGSAPERGVSAIRHMAEIVQRLEETLPDVTHEIVGGPSINVGTINGGAKVNIVPASCVIEVDRRSIPGETRESVTESVQAAIELARKKFPELDATVELPFYGEPFEIDESSRVVTDVLGAIEEVTGAPGEVVGFRGASDARFLAEAGATVVVCGPGDITLAHTAHESVDLNEVHRGAMIYALA
ncbi:MAG TPA: M20 family metallopeptidase, partial [Actinomycetota bacterium]|nr:M20 family metallopeptidase [Actinomycetota bacterium]